VCENAEGESDSKRKIAGIARHLNIGHANVSGMEKKCAADASRHRRFVETGCGRKRRRPERRRPLVRVAFPLWATGPAWIFLLRQCGQMGHDVDDDLSVERPECGHLRIRLTVENLVHDLPGVAHLLAE